MVLKDREILGGQPCFDSKRVFLLRLPRASWKLKNPLSPDGTPHEVATCPRWPLGSQFLNMTQSGGKFFKLRLPGRMEASTSPA